MSVLATLTIAGGGLLALAPPASAAPIGAIASTSGALPVYVGGTSEVAGDWTLAALPAVSIGDTVTVQVDDNGVDANCAATNDNLGFAAVPTVTNTTAGNLAQFTPTTSSSAGACTTSGVKDIATFTASTAGAAGAVLKITGVRYAVGTAVDTGAIRVSVAPGALSTANSNATVFAVRVTPGAPALVAPSTAGQAINNITLTELRPGAIPAGACIQLVGPGAIKFTAAAGGNPAVVASGTNHGTVGTVTATGNNDLSFTTTPGTGATTYTVSGIKVDPTAAVGPITATVGSTCGSSDYAPTAVLLGGVGTVDRLAGSNRYATAQIIADKLGACQDNVIVANGVNYPDALAASYLAGKTMPILLVADTIPTETANAITLHGVKNIFIVGGPNSVSPSIETTFQGQFATACGGAATLNKVTTVRIGGADRYATAKAVAEKLGLNAGGTAPTDLLANGCKNVPTAIVTSGENFPDALAAGVLSAGGAGCGAANYKPLPLLLTNAGSLNIRAAEALQDMGIKQVLLVGGPNTVTNTVLGSIQNVGGTNNITVKRIFGSNRQGTAANLAAVLGTVEFNYNGGQMLVTRGDIFPDALVGAPYGAQQLAPLLLSDSTTSLGTTAANAIITYPVALDEVTLLGGLASLSQAVADQAAAALASQPI